MAILRKPQKSELETLQQQRADLAERLAEADRIAKSADPVAEWEAVSKAASDYLALERAIYTLDGRIAEAEALAKAQATKERDAAKQERALAAKTRAEEIAEKLAGQMKELDAGLLADLDAALRELARADGYCPPAVHVARQLHHSINASINEWRKCKPAWFGLPEPEPVKVVQIRELQSTIERASDKIAELRRQDRTWRGKPGDEKPDFSRAIMFHAYGLEGAVRQLRYITGDQSIPMPHISELDQQRATDLDKWETIKGKRERAAAVHTARPDDREEPSSGLVSVPGVGYSPAPAAVD